MELILTAKIKILPSPEQIHILKDTFSCYQNGCNFVSKLIFEKKTLHRESLHKLTYTTLRSQYGLRSQMAQSVLKTVIAQYKSLKSNQHPWTEIKFKKPLYDLVFNRDYSFNKDFLSINTVHGRTKLLYKTTGLNHYFDGSWKFGTAKLINKHGHWYLHLPVTKDVPSFDKNSLSEIVGVDLGINFLTTSYDSKGKTTFVNGRAIKHRRAKYKNLRKELQQTRTPSARRKLKSIGQRENRWMQDINHCISKALVDSYPKNTLFVLEDLSKISQKTTKVKLNDRYHFVSWAFYDLRTKIEYKSLMNQSKTIVVNPKYTSQTCPKCNYTHKQNRNKKSHSFLCRRCKYKSNDDRIAAMNLQQKGIKYIVEEVT
ncbi:transposase [Planococcus maritimus]|nr:transposase [Planococcus sp. SK3692]MDE4085389.1 transposase [Planococcus maritimus]